MSASRVPDRLQRDRRAFTLVELLIVIGIIGILASMALFTLYGVQEDAREQRTRSIIAKANEVIQQKWETYRTRPLPIRIPPNTDPRTAAAMRLNALRELMRMELPDRVTDLAFPVNINDPPMFLTSSPSAWRTYRRRIAANAARGNTWTELHEHSECLYMILAATCDGNTTGLDSFSESEIGDTDNDGMPEILDGWGRPVYFLRWAPGLVSPLQDPNNRTPDPFDPLRVDPRWENNDNTPQSRLDDPFALFPLIYSGGRDRQFGAVRKDYEWASPWSPPPPPPPIPDREVFYQLTNFDPYNSAQLNTELYSYAPLPTPPWPPSWNCRPPNDPYMILPISGDYIGRQFVGGEADDDITNHLLEVR